MKYLTTVTSRSVIASEAESVKEAEEMVRNGKAVTRTHTETYNTIEDTKANSK